MDNAATTILAAEAKRAMIPFLDNKYANPSASYEFAKENKKVIEGGRSILAKMINASPNEIIFTSGGTEGDNFAVKQVCETFGKNRKHIITSKIEHHAVLNTCKKMEEKGFKVSYIGVNKYGRINLNELEKSITKDTILISVMHANNEIGTIEQTERIGLIAKKYGVLFHVDAVQTFCHIPVDVRYMNIDLLSTSAHKFNGPKGVGFIFVREGINVGSFMDGGMQENGIRAGTSNVPGIVGMVEAAKLNYKSMAENIKREIALRNYLIRRMVTEVPGVTLNGHPIYRLPNNANFTIKGVNGMVLLVMLDLKGVCISTASACSQTSKEPSHVLKAIGLSDEDAMNTIRITLSKDISKEDIDYTVNTIKSEVAKIYKGY